MSSDYLNALKEGEFLQEYQVVRVLGAGGFGLTYLAFDQNLDKPVAIKEYLPNDLAVRFGATSVKPKSTEAGEDFKWGLEQFLNEARTLAKFNHPNIIRINRFFEANGTGYIVMDYAEGQTLTAKIKEQSKLNESELKPLLLAVSEGLKQAHGFGILHRDIKPGNIMLLDDGTPILIDFGSARQAIGIKSKSVTSIVTPGYAPIEQYDSNGKQGPWTDIYALGAVAYVGLVGERPPDATGRIRVDTMISALEAAKGQASEAFLKAVDWALCPHEDSRPQNIDDWVAALSGGDIKKPQAPDFEDEKTVVYKPSSNAGRSKTKDKEHPQWLADNAPIETSVAEGGTTKWIVSIVIVAGLVLSMSYGSNWFSDDQTAIDSGVEGVADNVDEDLIDATIADTTQDNIVQDNSELTDQQAWNRALSINNIEGFLEYLTSFPAGNYITDADTHLTDLSEHNNIAENLVASTSVNVRHWPSTDASIVSVLPQRRPVAISGKVLSRDWYSLDLANNEKGYVHSSLLGASFDRPENAEQTAIEREREEIRQGWQHAIQQHNR